MEEIGDIIGKGFGIWRNNLNLCIPFLLNFFLSMLIVIPFLVAIFLVAMPLASMNSTSIQNVQDPQDMQILFYSDGRGSGQPGMARDPAGWVSSPGHDCFTVNGQSILHRRSHRHGQAGSGEGQSGYRCHVVCRKEALLEYVPLHS